MNSRSLIHLIGENPMIKIIPLLLMAALVLTGCAAPQASAASYRQINMQEALDIMTNETGHIILDVRTIAEYESGHILFEENDYFTRDSIE